jgi:flavodoxin
MSNVLVIFQSDTERTEQMALAIAVGAVEAQASIRLRRLAAPGAVEVAHKGYGKLQAADLLWANAVVVGLESPTPKADELEDLLSLTRGADAKKFSGKQAWTFSPESVFTTPTESQIFVESALRVAGFAVLPSDISTSGSEDNHIDSLKQAGRRIASNLI